MTEKKTYIVPEKLDAVDHTGPRYIGRIPKVIMHTNKSHEVPKHLYENIMSMIKLNPDMDYVHFSDSDIIDFIRKEYNEEYVTLFRRINSGAYKADFFRLLYIYKRGGIYCDSDLEMSVPFAEIIKNHDKLIVLLDGAPFVYGCWNAIIIAPPNHEALKINIDYLVDFIKNYKNEVRHPLFFGPHSLYRSLIIYLGANKLKPGMYKDVLIYEGLSHIKTIKTSIVGPLQVGRVMIIIDKKIVGYSRFKDYFKDEHKTNNKTPYASYGYASRKGKIIKSIEELEPL